MPIVTLLNMIAVIGIVWGGLSIVLILAIRKENQKDGEAEEPEIYPTA